MAANASRRAAASLVAAPQYAKVLKAEKVKEKRAASAEAARAAKKARKTPVAGDDGEDGGDDRDDAGPAAAAAAAAALPFIDGDEPMVYHKGGVATDEFDEAMGLMSAPIALSADDRTKVIKAAATNHGRPWLGACHAGACEWREWCCVAAEAGDFAAHSVSISHSLLLRSPPLLPAAFNKLLLEYVPQGGPTQGDWKRMAVALNKELGLPENTFTAEMLHAYLGRIKGKKGTPTGNGAHAAQEEQFKIIQRYEELLVEKNHVIKPAPGSLKPRGPAGASAASRSMPPPPPPPPPPPSSADAKARHKEGRGPLGTHHHNRPESSQRVYGDTVSIRREHGAAKLTTRSPCPRFRPPSRPLPTRSLPKLHPAFTADVQDGDEHAAEGLGAQRRDVREGAARGRADPPARHHRGGEAVVRRHVVKLRRRHRLPGLPEERGHRDARGACGQGPRQGGQESAGPVAVSALRRRPCHGGEGRGPRGAAAGGRRGPRR